jgi:hypothetical protein
LGKLPRAKVVKDHQVGTDLLGQNERAQFTQPKAQSPLSSGYVARAFHLLHLNPRRSRSLERTGKICTGNDNLGVNLSRDREFSEKLPEQVERLDFG